jgi:transposase
MLRKVGTHRTEVLEYVPSSLDAVSCRVCETIMQAPLPSFPIERGRPGPGLLAHVGVGKYADGLPLLRQTEIYERGGVELKSSRGGPTSRCFLK